MSFAAAFNRYNSDLPIPDIAVPRTGHFPERFTSAGFQPEPGASQQFPQATIQSTYQLQNNVIWTKGRHDLKFGIDGRQLKGASTFIQRSRGDYTYSTLERYLSDLVPGQYCATEQRRKAILGGRVGVVLVRER